MSFGAQRRGASHVTASSTHVSPRPADPLERHPDGVNPVERAMEQAGSSSAPVAAPTPPE